MGRIAILWAAMAAMIGLGPASQSPAVAMGLCNCCASELSQSCGKVCAAISLKPGHCPAIVDFDGSGAVSQSVNPLNGLSLKELSLGEPTRWQLELFRKFMESGRKKGIVSYNSAVRQLRSRQITRDDFEKVNALYRESNVNYYHGIRAYLNRVGAKSD